MPIPPDPPDRGAVGRRDAGLRRVSRLTRWLLAGSLALTAAFSAIAARTVPGSSSKQTTTSTTADQSSDADASGAGQSGDDLGTLQPPASDPSASAGQGSVTSGGS